MQVKDFVFRNAQALILIVAILIWVWANYIYDKEPTVIEIPRAQISHEIFSACLNSEQRLVRAKVEVRNVGPVEVKLTKNHHSVAQVSPPPVGKKFDDADHQDLGPKESKPGLIVWPEILAKSPPNSTEVSLQPNEIYEQYHDFVISPSARVIEVTSTFGVAPKRADDKIPPWQAKKMYDVGDPTCPQLPGSVASDTK